VRVNFSRQRDVGKISEVCGRKVKSNSMPLFTCNKRRHMKFWIFLMTFVIATAASNAQTRSGRAAYHYHSSQMITAARYEPIGSVLDVTNPENGKTVRVRVTGAGPYNGNRILDLSTGAFSQLYNGTGRGVGPVRYTVVSRGGGARAGKTNRRKYSRKYRSSRYHRQR
jgi:rare lipoprotein A